VAVGRTYLLPPLSSDGASLVRLWLRFHTHRVTGGGRPPDVACGFPAPTLLGSGFTGLRAPAAPSMGGAVYCPFFDLVEGVPGEAAAGAKHHIERKKPMPYFNHYSFHILDPDWGHLTIKISGHPPFPAQVILNDHEYVACQRLPIIRGSSTAVAPWKSFPRWSLD
jgi:hypothetical protein